MQRIKKGILVLLFILIAPTLTYPVLSAQEDRAGNGLSITPPRTELVIERGSSQTVTVQVKNVSNVPVLVRAQLNDFEADGETGNPKLIVDESIQSANSIKEFLTGIENFELAAGETKDVTLFVEIPAEAAPGAYYGAVRFIAGSVGSGDDSEAPQLSLNASVATLVLIDVPGDIVERIEVSSIDVYINGQPSFFFTKKPDEIGVAIKNLGNGFSKPFGKVFVSGPWGSSEVYSYELNNTIPRGNVLPDQTRVFRESFADKIKFPGKYKITGGISHGKGGEILNASTSFWYIPVWALAVFAAALLLFVLIAVRMYRKYSTRKTKRT